MQLLNSILDLVFPPVCLACGKNGEYLCTECISAMPSAERESADWIHPMLDYRHKPLKDALWQLKYSGKRQLAEVFAEILYPRMLEELADRKIMENFGEPLLLPIPLSRKRRRERGFNQAELICRKLVELDREENFTLETGALARPKDSEHQARIEERKKRLENIVGAFSVKNPEKISGRNIILIDDITTTGATLSEAKKVLREAGARKVVAFTVAH
ncbi:MAG: ComF family protein [Patescibacteria group bacterium]